jgi:hypothetical protein
MAQRGQGVGRLPNQGRRRTGEENDKDQGKDFLPTTNKLEFLKFNGVEDPLP